MLDMTIKYSKGVTINLGNYQSARVDIGAEFQISSRDYETEMAKLKSLIEGELVKEVEKERQKK